MKNAPDIYASLEELFHPSSAPDYPPALNGLQLENGGVIRKIAAAVDASERAVDQAIEAGADLLLVHHGLFWSGLRPLTGAFYRKLKKCMDADLAVYSLHLPLDAHEKFGNSRLLAERLELQDIRPFMEWKGLHTGVSAVWNGTGEELHAALERAVGGPVQWAAKNHDALPGTVAIVSGGSGGDLETVARQEVRTFIAGEGSHWTVPLAEELEINLFYAGHYATETFGVRSLAEWLSIRFDLPCVFLDLPTGR